MVRSLADRTFQLRLFSSIPAIEAEHDEMSDTMSDFSLRVSAAIAAIASLALSLRSAAALVERFDRRGIEPFELFKSEFGQNSWNPKKTTKSTVAKRTTATKQHPTQNTRRGRTNGKKRETNCTEGARRTTLSHRIKRWDACLQKIICLPSALPRCGVNAITDFYTDTSTYAERFQRS